MKAKQTETPIPTFNLQAHHQKVKVPSDFDLRDLSRRYQIFPLKIIAQNGKRKLLLAMRDINNQKAVYDVEFRAGMSVIPVQANDVDIQWLIQTHYYGRNLSPVPQVEEREILHDLFEQLEITTDAQKQPEWLNESLQRYVVVETKDK